MNAVAGDAEARGAASARRGILHRIARAGVPATMVCLTSCTSPRGPLPPAPPMVQVTVRDSHVDLDGLLHPGRVVFEIRNAGRVPHRLALIPLAPDAPPLDQLIGGANPRAVVPVAGVPNLVPGGRDTFAVDLRSGRYLLIDLGFGADHQSNARKGVAADLRVS